MTGSQLDSLLHDTHLDRRPQVAALRRLVIEGIACLRHFVDLPTGAVAGEVFDLAADGDGREAEECAANLEGLAMELKVLAARKGETELVRPRETEEPERAAEVPGELEMRIEAGILAGASR